MHRVYFTMIFVKYPSIPWFNKGDTRAILGRQLFRPVYTWYLLERDSGITKEYLVSFLSKLGIYLVS